MEEQTQKTVVNNVRQNDANVVVKIPSVHSAGKKSVETNVSTVGEDIFTRYLANAEFTTEADFAKQIEQLKLSNEKNFLKIAKVIISYLDKHKFGDDKDNFYQHLLDLENVQIKRTQADKYIAVYKYCEEKYKKNTLTENTIKLGIEKLYYVTTLEDKTKQEKLENFITAKKLTTKKLAELVKIQNKTSPVLELSEEFNSLCKGQD